MTAKTKVVSMTLENIGSLVASHVAVSGTDSFNGLIGGTNAKGVGVCIMIKQDTIKNMPPHDDVVVTVCYESADDISIKDLLFLDTLVPGLGNEMFPQDSSVPDSD